MGALYLGVDVGTSSVKLTCIDEGGKLSRLRARLTSALSLIPVGGKSIPRHGGSPFALHAPCLERKLTCL